MKLFIAIHHFERQMRADGKSALTREGYLRDLRALARSLGRDVEISTLSPDHLARFLTSKAFLLGPTGQPKAPITINRSKSALRSFFRFLADSGYVNVNPARLIRSSPVSQKPPQPLTAAEVRKLLETIRRGPSPTARRDLVMFTLLASTGMRLGSLVRLTVGDVDVVGRTVRVKGKGNVEQVLFLNPVLRRLLRRYLDGRTDPSAPLFLSAQGWRIGARQVQLRLARWLGVAGIKRRASVHTLRHSFATLLYETTGDLRLVQTALGHRRLSTTEIYTRVQHQRVQHALRTIGERFVADRR